MPTVRPMQNGDRLKGAHPATGFVRVIRLPSNGSYDYQLQVSRARELFNEGKLALDMTSGCYTTYEYKMNNNPGPKVI